MRSGFEAPRGTGLDGRDSATRKAAEGGEEERFLSAQADPFTGVKATRKSRPAPFAGRRQREERFHCAKNTQWRRGLAAEAGTFAPQSLLGRRRVVRTFFGEKGGLTTHILL